jgi:hypothetical protein
MKTDKMVWLAVATGATAFGAFLVRKGLQGAWRAATDEDPPLDPNSRDVPLRHAIIWTAAVGAMAGVGRLVALRGAQAGWHRITGEYPPD